MPRRSNGPRLYLRRREGRRPEYVIRDGRCAERRTGCGVGELAKAKIAFAAYLTERHDPRRGKGDPRQIPVADALNVYAAIVAADPAIKRKDVIAYTIESLLPYWADKFLSDVKRSTCAEYVAMRTGQTLRTFSRPGVKTRTVSVSTARRDLETLRAAINSYHAETPLNAVPTVTMPAKANPRDRWLTRAEAAALIRAARAEPRTRHVARFILIGLYTGTRHEAILRLMWHRTPAAGWIDLEAGVMHRRGQAEQRTKKIRPPSKLPRRLLVHLRRWHRLDRALAAELGRPVNVVVNFYGRPVTRLKRGWHSVRDRAGLELGVTPHVLRHTAATWLMQRGIDPWDAAGYLGMSVEILDAVYGHHHPDFQKGAANAF